MQHAIEHAKTVYLVDDDAAVLRYAGATLKAAGYEVRAFADGADFLAACTSEMRGCIVLDLQLPDSNGDALQRELRRRGVSCPILFLSGQGDISTVVAAMKEGAVDFIEKPVAGPELVDRVSKAIERDDSAIACRTVRQSAIRRWRDLSPREQEVCTLVSDGEPNKRVASALGISERTVEVHRARGMTKLAVGSLAELVRLRIARDPGLISPLL